MKKHLLFISCMSISAAVFSQAGVGIGVISPHPSAALHVQPPTNNKGMLIPRLTTQERNLINPPADAEGLLVYDTDVNALYHFNGTWQQVGLPQGSIIMWSGAVVPEGWELCDGDAGTPDLRGRFIVASGQNQDSEADDTNPAYVIGPGSGADAGRNQITLTSSQIPAHTHPTSTSPHSHSVQRFQEGANDWRSGGNSSPGNGTGGNITTTTGATSVNVTVNANVGGGQPFENRPPYYVLAFIMKK